MTSILRTSATSANVPGANTSRKGPETLSEAKTARKTVADYLLIFYGKDLKQVPR